MEKKEILKYFNGNGDIVTNKNNTAFNITVTSDDIDVIIILNSVEINE